MGGAGRFRGLCPTIEVYPPLVPVNLDTMSKRSPGPGLSIGEVSARTGLGEATLRAWERRHGFPVPAVRSQGAHRRYAEADVAVLLRVVVARERGLSVPAAIEEARQTTPRAGTSIFSEVRRAHPELIPQRLAKRHLLVLSRAVEDEARARADRPLLIGAFQHERIYRSSQRRWRDMASVAAVAIALAEFDRTRPERSPAEVALATSSPAGQEWAVVVHGATLGAFLSGWELPGQQRSADADRRFEVLWSVDPEAVMTAARAAIAVVARESDDLATRASAELDSHPPPPAAEQLRLGVAITSRVLAALSSADSP